MEGETKSIDGSEAASVRPAYAHSVAGRPKGEWHRLEEHLRSTGERARRFAASWGAGEWAFLAGIWHDLGKYSDAFQRHIGAAGDDDAHLEGSAVGRVNHSSAGAIHAVETLGIEKGLPLAFVIAGHHAGLADLQDELRPRLLEKELLAAARAGGAGGFCAEHPITIDAPQAPPGLSRGERLRFHEFWIRFLFSSLVDADFLDTEAFYNKTKSRSRGNPNRLSDLVTKIDTYVDRLSSNALPGRVTDSRRRILNACRNAAASIPGAFSLTAPTGSGKTLAGMSFALRHALTHGLDRVIVALPFTSIIEQSSSEYRKVFGEGVVVEHHSNLDPLTEDHRNRLASENWDAPIVVTTTVQLFESLFGNRTSACRKLHNIAKAVIILDEAQTLPSDLLYPILDVLGTLAARYGSTVVISTATQPALRERSDFPGLPGVREIIPEPEKEFGALRRARVEWPADIETPTTWEALADELRDASSFLVIVHKRADARTLATLFPEEVIHLSASMCAAHRLETIRAVKRDLGAGKSVRVVSTQLVEAGVDFDFPVVYRALAGLDAIAQAAGRCNREGRLPEGRVVVFVAPTEPPPGILRKGLDTTRTLLGEMGPSLDPLSPEPFDKYFRKLYFLTEGDRQGIQSLREGLKFRTVAKEFRMIENAGNAIVVPYASPAGTAAERLETLRRDGPSKKTLRALQPFLVNVFPKALRALQEAGAVEAVADTVYALSPPYHHLYDSRFGLLPADDAVAAAESLVL